MAPRAKALECSDGAGVLDGELVEVRALHVHAFRHEVRAQHGRPRHELAAGRIGELADGAGRRDEVVPRPVVARHRHARTLEEIEVQVEADGREVLGDPVERTLAAGRAIEAEGVDGGGIEVGQVDGRRILRRAVGLEEWLERPDEADVGEARDALVPHIEDIRRLARGEHGHEFRVEAAGIAGIDTADLDAGVGLLEGAQARIDDLVLFLAAITGPVHDDQFSTAIGAARSVPLAHGDVEECPSDDESDDDHGPAAQP